MTSKSGKLLGAIVALIAVGAVAAARPTTDAGPRALRIVRELVAEGQRWAGAPGRARAIDGLARRMERAGLSVERDAFTTRDPLTGVERPMVNLVGRFRPEASCRILLGSHFDTRHVAEEDPDPGRRREPIPGANDGTSGVAVLLALAPDLPRVAPPGMGVDVVLFDGEEMGYPQVGGYCAGSEHFARSALASSRKPAFGIVLDMVCDERGVYEVERNSRADAPRLVDAIWAEGARIMPGAFARNESLAIFDDHVPLSRAGIPAALVIGFNYPPWHTHADDVGRCSERRLGRMVDLLAQLLRRDATRLAGCGR